MDKIIAAFSNPSPSDIFFMGITFIVFCLVAYILWSVKQVSKILDGRKRPSESTVDAMEMFKDTITKQAHTEGFTTRWFMVSSGVYTRTLIVNKACTVTVTRLIKDYKFTYFVGEQPLDDFLKQLTNLEEK